ncbi:MULTISPECIES: hypothetical protein [Rhodococcus]|uniref:hypothetical protein n=1 Tax=Rhodococcus TaxID=1827 RepID=UPI0012F88A0A|nr:MULTISPECIES: hypothetical protein [Rhodococcus]QQZ19490.1 hypothetical protein GO592_43205 [Rhodococcus sp. 21391]
MRGAEPAVLAGAHTGQPGMDLTATPSAFTQPAFVRSGVRFEGFESGGAHLGGRGLGIEHPRPRRLRRLALPALPASALSGADATQPRGADDAADQAAASPRLLGSGIVHKRFEAGGAHLHNRCLGPAYQDGIRAVAAQNRHRAPFLTAL